VLNIKLLFFWLKHQRHISRIPVIGKLTVALVRQWRDQSVFEDEYEVTMTHPIIDEKYLPNTMEEISVFLPLIMANREIHSHMSFALALRCPLKLMIFPQDIQ
jgi:hypothetical protein